MWSRILLPIIVVVHANDEPVLSLLQRSAKEKKPETADLEKESQKHQRLVSQEDIEEATGVKRDEAKKKNDKWDSETGEEDKGDDEDVGPNCEDIGSAQFEQDFKEAIIDAAEDADISTGWEFHQGACQYKYEGRSPRRRRIVQRTYEFPPKSEQQKVPCDEVAQFCAQACEKEETCMAFEVTLQRGLPDYSWCKIHGSEDDDLPMKSLPVAYDTDWISVPSRRRSRSYPDRNPDHVYTGDATMSTYCMARLSKPEPSRRREKTPAPTPFTPFATRGSYCRPTIESFLLCDSVVQTDVETGESGKLKSVLYKQAGSVRGKSVDLLVSVSAASEYKGKADRCGRNGCLGILNVQTGSEVGFDFKLFETGTDIPFTADEVHFEVLDLDCGPKSKDNSEVCGATEFVKFETDMEVESMGWEIAESRSNGAVQYEASVVGKVADNPSNTTDMEEVAKGRLIRVKYTGVHSWRVHFGVTEKSRGKGYRNFLFDASWWRGDNCR